MSIKEDFLQKNNPKLKMVAMEIETITPQLKKTQRKMMVLMRRHSALGIAAPQIGRNGRMITVRIEGKIITMINPVIEKYGKSTESKEEASYSIDETETKFMKKRSINVLVSWKNLNGTEFTNSFSDLPARIIQHVIDQLDGVMINE